MRTLALIAAFLVALASPAETLRDILKSNGVPEDSFRKAELDEGVNGAAATRDGYVLIVYLRVEGELLTGYPRLVRYDKKSGVILRSEVKPEDENRCCGSPGGIEFVGDFAILSFHINPSAEARLVLGKDLKLAATLYGFDVREVAPGQVVFIENMIHFAPVHPERLAFADLRSGKREELYPLKADPLRAAFAREHAKHMPSQGTCQQMNDPCDPDLYDEGIELIEADGNGSFAFVVQRDALHAAVSEQEPESVASEAALYRYARNQGGWLYCEQGLTADEVKALVGHQKHDGHSQAKTRCTPSLPVAPEWPTSD